MLWLMLVWSTYKVVHNNFVYIKILRWHLRSNKGQIIFNRLYLINGTSYDKNVYKIHIVNHIWPFNIPYSIWLWMTLKGQTKVIEFWAGLLSYTKHVMTKSDMISQFISIPLNYYDILRLNQGHVMLNAISPWVVVRLVKTFAEKFSLNRI